MSARRHSIRLATLVSLVAAPAALHAQESGDAPTRTRVALGPQFSPAWPGADEMSIRPFIDVSRSPVGTPFEYEAPDESFGFSLFDAGKVEFGPALGIVGKRSAKDVGADVPSVGFSIEVGAFAQAYVTPNLRLRIDGRKGLSGHDGWIGEVSADYVARRGDDWLFSIGPRVTLSDSRHHRAYFGVTPAAAATSGLPAFDPGGGVQAVGVTAGYQRQLGDRWGVAAYARYDRLVGDAADSPIVRNFGSRDQPSVGIALSYTFGGTR